MAKRFFDAMGYRPPTDPTFKDYNPFLDRASPIETSDSHYVGSHSGYKGKPSPESLGLEELQTCNNGFYAKDANNANLYNRQPDWNEVKTILVQNLNLRKSLYFDLEYWVTVDYHTKYYEYLNDKAFAATLVTIYSEILRENSITSGNMVRGVYGIPNGNINPLNPQTAINAWTGIVSNQMNGGEISDLLMQNINCIFPSFYPYDYANGDINKTIQIQKQYNQLVIDVTRSNNIYNYPIYGFFTPRLIKPNGTRPFLDYNTAYNLADWILTNCDGIVLWDWDGYGYGEKAYGTEVALWDNNAPWFLAIKSLQGKYNITPTYQTINAQHPNSGIRFR
jgi:hypothetical protein